MDPVDLWYRDAALDLIDRLLRGDDPAIALAEVTFPLDLPPVEGRSVDGPPAFDDRPPSDDDPPVSSG